MPDVPDQIGPRDAVCGFNEPRVSDWSEGFTNIGGIGYIAVGGEEEGAKSCGIGSVANVGIR